MDAKNKVILIFVCFAVVVGFLCGLAKIKSFGGLLFALAFFYISYKAIPYFLNLEESSYDAKPLNLIKTGAIPYWFLWLVFWIWAYTLRISGNFEMIEGVAFGFEIGAIILLPIIWFIIAISLCVWVYKDAKARGENATLWLIIVLITGVLGLIIWVIVRPKEVAAKT